MRPVRRISLEEENLRTESRRGLGVIRRDPVEPEPVGTIVLCAFRVEGYDPDCDGSLMARLVNVDRDGESTGWRVCAIGLYPESNAVVTLDELRTVFGGEEPQR